MGVVPEIFGLNKELDLSPIKTSTERNPNKLGILPGSANNPAKRWPIHKWKKLVELLLNKNKSINIFIYGAFQESELANQISGDFDNSRVINLCGKTSLSELAEELASCAKVVGMIQVACILPTQWVVHPQCYLDQLTEGNSTLFQCASKNYSS